MQGEPRRERSERPAAIIDGRRLRREQGRLAALDAMIDLVMEGHAPPTVEQVTDRAGVSAASLFRYFPTIDDLRRESIEHYFDRYGELMAVPDLGTGPLALRIENLVGARVRFYETTEPMARLARRQASQVPELGATLVRLRKAFADQIVGQFAPELASLSSAARRERVALLAALTSFESWDQLREQGLDRDGVRRALGAALDRLLGASGRTPREERKHARPRTVPRGPTK